MSEGLKTLLEAARYIEQQEKLKLSPEAVTIIPPTLLGSDEEPLQHHPNHHHPLINHHQQQQQPRFVLQTGKQRNGITQKGSVGHVVSLQSSVGGISIRGANNLRANTAGGRSTLLSSSLPSQGVSSSANADTSIFQHNGIHGTHHRLHHHSQTALQQQQQQQQQKDLLMSHGSGEISNDAVQHHNHNSNSNSNSNNNHHQHNHYHPHPRTNSSSSTGSNCSNNSQLLNANHHDYEFSTIDGGALTILAGPTTPPSPSLSLTSATAVATQSPTGTNIVPSQNINNNNGVNGNRSIEARLSVNHQLQLQMLNSNSLGGSNSNSSGGSTHMLVDDLPPNQHHPSSFVAALGGVASGSGQPQHSPPQRSPGNHYIQMMNTAASGQASAMMGGLISSVVPNHVSHVTTTRRRTISSNSNGAAGTREVHNKLEKNRRAHLKECYEALKKQLSLKDEDRRKTSNLAILGEALKCVQTFQKRKQELEAEWEHLANDKINLQKRVVSLKRELGSKYEQIFLGIFPDIELGGIPNESGIDNMNDSISLSSGCGSTLYSSSSSLSSGGGSNNSNSSNSNSSINIHNINNSNSNSNSNNNNIMSSPVGAGLNTVLQPVVSPVINRTNRNSNPSNSIKSHNNTINYNSSTITSLQSNNCKQYRQTAVHHHPSIGIPSSPTSSPTALIAFTTTVGGLSGGNSSSPNNSSGSSSNSGSGMSLSLTAKNISAALMTRGSPTPSTPSPSSSSSSGVSSSSSLISSSPPINGVIGNGRSVTLNIPNGLKLQTAASTLIPTATLVGVDTSSTTAALGIPNSTTSNGLQGSTNTNNDKTIILQVLRGCHLA